MKVEFQNTHGAEESKCVVKTPSDLSHVEVFDICSQIFQRFVGADEEHRSVVFFAADDAVHKLKALTFSPNKHELANIFANAMVQYKPLAEAILEASEWYAENND